MKMMYSIYLYLVIDENNVFCLFDFNLQSTNLFKTNITLNI